MASVLVIDDDVSLRTLMRRALARAGHDVAEASNGAAGMEQFRASPFDVVITDVFMPVQDGIETIQQLRADFPSAYIIAISGNHGKGPLIDAQLFGAHATLAKPFSADELVHAVALLIGGK